jgi:hypothetical protein
VTVPAIHKILTYLIASVWLVNGLFCKVLNLVPRHEQIVANILCHDFARSLTVLIGLSEIVMAGWIVTGQWKRLNAITQISIVATMNVLEFILVPHLLLWGRFNALFATVFIGLVYCHGFILNRKATQAL